MDFCSLKKGKKKTLLPVMVQQQEILLQHFHFLHLHEVSFLQDNVAYYHKQSICLLALSMWCLCCHFYSNRAHCSCCTPRNPPSLPRTHYATLNIGTLPKEKRRRRRYSRWKSSDSERVYVLCADGKEGFKITLLLYEILLFFGLFVSLLLANRLVLISFNSERVYVLCTDGKEGFKFTLLLANRLVFALDFNEARTKVGRIPRGGIIWKKRSKLPSTFLF